MSQSDPDLVSVVLPVFNGEKYISYALDSVLNQSYQNFEIIVVNDGSVDSTCKVLEKYEQKIHVINLKSNKGLWYSKNLAIDSSKGSLISFLDHDDRWTLDKLSIQVEFLKKNKNIDYVISRMTSELEEGVSWPKELNYDYYSKDSVALIFGTTLVRRSSFLKVGYFRSDFGNVDDVDWFARASNLGLNRGVINKSLLIKRIHKSNTSLSTKKNDDNLFKALRKSIKNKEVKL